MPNSTRTWQLISLALTVALIATLVKLYRNNAAQPTDTGTLPNGSSATNLEHLALSPNARRAHERYSL